MKTDKVNVRTGVITLTVLAAAFSRLIPHPWNFTAIGATALFGAAYYSNRLLALSIPLLALWLSDLVMNNTIYSGFNNHSLWLFPSSFPWDYAAFLLVGVTGMGLLKKINLTRVIGASVTASVVFFLASNFGCWLGSALYPHSLGGLMLCYGAGIPFFWNSVAGDLFYCGILFGAFELAKFKFQVLGKTSV